MCRLPSRYLPAIDRLLDLPSLRRWDSIGSHWISTLVIVCRMHIRNFCGYPWRFSLHCLRRRDGVGGSRHHYILRVLLGGHFFFRRARYLRFVRGWHLPGSDWSIDLRALSCRQLQCRSRRVGMRGLSLRNGVVDLRYVITILIPRFIVFLPKKLELSPCR